MALTLSRSRMTRIGLRPAETNGTGVQAYSYGRVVRNGVGTLTYTRIGDAIGEFDQATNTISIKVIVPRLNAALGATGRPLIGHGSVIAGLRA